MAKLRTEREHLEEKERKAMEKFFFAIIGLIFVVLLLRACNVVAGSDGSLAERQVVRDLDRIAAGVERIAAALEKGNR